VPITKVELNLRRSARLDDRLEVSAVLAPSETAKLAMAYEVRRLPERTLLATGTTEQVILNPRGELLLTLPLPVRTLVERILAFQRGEADPDPAKILPPR